MMTIAPEIPGAIETIAEAARRNVCVSIGHSDADLEAARAGVRAGARHATHTFNAMRPLDHREPGILGEVLGDDNISADIIADGIHVAPEVVKLFLQAKGMERSVLITDATAAAGMPEGSYQLGPIKVMVKDGKCTMDGKLAGSVLTMDRAVRNIRKFAGWSLRDAVRAATLNAAQAVRPSTTRRIVSRCGSQSGCVEPRGRSRENDNPRTWFLAPVLCCVIRCWRFSALCRTEPVCRESRPIGILLVWLAFLRFHQVAQKESFVRAIELIQKRGVGFGLFQCCRAGRLPQLISQLGIVAHHLCVEPQEMSHLIERLAQALNRFGFRQRAQGFHQFGVAGCLHGSAVQFALNHAQVFGDSHHSRVKVIHLCAVPHALVR